MGVWFVIVDIEVKIVCCMIDYEILLYIFYGFCGILRYLNCIEF